MNFLSWRTVCCRASSWKWVDVPAVDLPAAYLDDACLCLHVLSAGVCSSTFFFPPLTANLFMVSSECYWRSVWTEVLGFQVNRKLFLLLPLFTCVIFMLWKVFANCSCTFCGEDLITTLFLLVSCRISEGNLMLIATHVLYYTQIKNL